MKTGIAPKRSSVKTLGSWRSGADTVVPVFMTVRLVVVASISVRGTRTLPGFVNAHCHAFQRSLRGRAAGTDFWAWREEMLAEAKRQTPALVRRSYVNVYRELRAAGWTAVGGVHFLGPDEARPAAGAAAEAEGAFVLLHVPYARGGP